MNAAPTQVLVVDDERFFREAIRELLEGEGIDGAARRRPRPRRSKPPTTRASASSCSTSSCPIRAASTVLRVLRERRPALRVVMLSAHTDQEYVLEALRLGACDYLAKPLHEEEVRLSVRRALEAYELASSWDALRGRLGALAGEVEALLGDGVRSEREALAARAAEAVAPAARRRQDVGAAARRRRRASCASRPRPAASSRPRSSTRSPIGEGVAGRAVAQGEAIVVDDVARDPRFAAAPGRSLRRRAPSW